MKRRWRLGRVVLALMLLGIAALAYWIWPGVSWKLSKEEPIGFDVGKSLLYTVKSGEGKYELRGYDLASGERRKAVSLEPESISETGAVILVAE